MQLNIKDAETHTLAKRLANLTGESMTKAVKRAIQEKLVRVEKMQGGTPLADELDRIALYCARLPRRDERSSDEIIGYDESGLPA
ncbi:MAG: type II toxin-antitoxin system VapB family antitoxin [Nitrospinae bacterium]|nr:type II toxin-antitoxin system VapB family antitoxin [Nitrospinota bacterium]